MTEKEISERVLIEVYRNIMDEIHLFVQLMWENVKFFTSFLAALLTVDLTLTNIFFQNETNRVLFLPFSFVMPILMLLVSCIGRSELKRRWLRLNETLAAWGKVCVLLGLDKDINKELRDAGILIEDKFIFQRFVESMKKYKTTKAFVESAIEKHYTKDLIGGKNFYFMISRIYIVFFLISILILSIKIFLIMSYIN